MTTLQEYKEKRMKDPEFAEAYNEYSTYKMIVRALQKARIESDMTQKELSERTGIAQAEISRLENGSRNPSIKLLERLADGMDMDLQINFVRRKHIP